MSNLSGAIVEAFGQHRKKTYISAEQDLKFSELEADVAALAQYLANAGLRGERVIIATTDDRALLTTFYASILAGATAVILDSHAPVTELNQLIAAADAKGICADKPMLERLAADGNAAPASVVLPVEAGERKKGGLRLFGKPKVDETAPPTFANILERNAGTAMAPADSGEEDIAYILFTSGTTSRPKGVMISHRALLAQMRTFISNYSLDAGSNVMNLLPFHHTDGLTQGATMCLLSGATFVRPYAFTPDILPRMMQDLYKYSISHLVTVPSVMALTKGLDEDFDSSFDYPEFRFVVSTAAYLDPVLWQNCEERFDIQIVNVYGLTETVCETIYCGPRAEHRKMGTIGKPIDSEAKILNDEGEELGVGQSGELVVAGPHIMSGYFNNPEATAAVLQDGWFRTGDLAERDDEGFYSIVGRKKDLIISAGMNIYPEDVSSVLRTVPGVLDAVTFGEPDALWGERAVSCVICDGSVDPSVEDIVAAFLERASRQKLPHDILKLEAFPRGPAGKVVMNDIRDIYRRHVEAKKPAITDLADIEGNIFGVAADILRCQESDLNRSSRAESVPGWTSLAHVELMLAVEEAYEFKMTAQEIMKFRTLGDIIDIVHNHRKS